MTTCILKWIQKEAIPQLLDVQKVTPIQHHHAAFTAMEGMARFAIENILKNDQRLFRIILPHSWEQTHHIG